MNALLLVGVLTALSSATPPEAPAHGLLARLNAVRVAGPTCPDGVARRPAP